MEFIFYWNDEPIATNDEDEDESLDESNRSCNNNTLCSTNID